MSRSGICSGSPNERRLDGARQRAKAPARPASGAGILSGRLAQREAGLACVALLAAVGSLALTSGGKSHAHRLPRPAGSYTALAGVSSDALGKRTACGNVIGVTTQGVAHPVLPCGVRLYITYDGKHVLTQVIDRGPYVPGREFDLTPALAARLGLSGVQTIDWSYAGAS